eukprot:scaffold34882_cov52-Attheya_sp.AAC.6
MGDNPASSVAIPSSVSALLAEETTIDPLSPLPSFLELMLVDATTSSGRAALSAALDATASSAATSAVAYRDGWKGRFLLAVARLGRRYRAEILLILTYAIERSCLHSKSICATASESVYSLKRSKLYPMTSSDGAGSSTTAYRSLARLPTHDKTRVALIASLGPYLKDRLDTWYQNARTREQMGMNELEFASQQQQQQPLSHGSFDWRLQRKRTTEKIRSLFVLVYPYLHMTHEGTIVFYQWSYLVGRSVFYSPSLHALGMIIRRVTMADIQTQNNTKSLAQSSKELSKPKIEDAIKAARKLAGYGLVAAVMIGWASNIRTELHRRRQQWINESVSSQINTRAPNISLPANPGAGIAVPPPQPPKVMLSSNTPIQSLPLNKALCPLCRQTRVNPVASTSGYVFCYRCLVLYVRDHGTCPLTGLPCPESKLVRVYETEQEHNQ